MKRIHALLLFIFICEIVIAADNIRPSRDKYISEHKDDAIRDMLKSGVPASITLAQACLESRDGCSALAKDANNHFGIKCSDWSGASYIQDDDKKDECFRKYNTTLESYDDHSLFLRSRSRYSSLFSLKITDYKGWAKGLKKAGYATDPTYATRLIKIIEDNQLYLLDKEVNVQFTASLDNKPDNISTNETPPSVKSRKVVVPSVDAVDAFPTRNITSINGIDCIIVKKGDDMRSIAKELDLGYWQLPKYNEMTNETSLVEGQIIYIKPKKNVGAESVYIVKPGDTVHSISQENGIKSKYIYKYNHLPVGAKIEPGQQLILDKSAPVKS